MNQVGAITQERKSIALLRKESSVDIVKRGSYSKLHRHRWQVKKSLDVFITWSGIFTFTYQKYFLPSTMRIDVSRQKYKQRSS